MNGLLPLSLAKSHLRVTTDDEDAYISALIMSAESAVETRVGVINAVPVTEKVSVGPNTAALNLRNAPVGSVTSVTAPNGSDVGWLRLNSNAGILSTGTAYEERVLLTPGEWTVVYTGGWSERGDYERTIKPQLMLMALHTLEDLYDNRNARATSEKAGTLGNALDNSTALPPRAESIAVALMGSGRVV